MRNVAEELALEHGVLGVVKACSDVVCGFVIKVTEEFSLCDPNAVTLSGGTITTVESKKNALLIRIEGSSTFWKNIGEK